MIRTLLLLLRAPGSIFGEGPKILQAKQPKNKQTTTTKIRKISPIFLLCLVYFLLYSRPLLNNVPLFSQKSFKMRFFSCPWAFSLPLPSTFFCSKRNKCPPFHTFTYFWLESITSTSSARIISALSISVESISVSRGIYSPFSMPPFWFRNLLRLSFTIETASYKIT